MTAASAPSDADVAALEAEWRRLERDGLPGKLRAYQRWQAAWWKRYDAERRQRAQL